MRHLAALVCTAAFLAASSLATSALHAQNSFPDNSNFRSNTPPANSGINNRNPGSTTSGFNNASSLMQNNPDAPEIFTIEITEEQLRDLRNGYKLETIFPERIRQSVKKIQLKLVASEQPAQTAGLPNNGGTINSTTDPNMNRRINPNASQVPPFRQNNTNSGLPNNRSDSSRFNSGQPNGSGLPANPNPNFGASAQPGQANNQWGSPVATRQYNSQAGPPIPGSVNAPFGRSNTQPINSNQPPRFNPRTPPNNSGINPNPTFVPPNNRNQLQPNQLQPNQMRPSTANGSEFDTTYNSNQPFNNRGQNPNSNPRMDQNQFAGNQSQRNNSGLQAPAFNQQMPQRPFNQSGGFRPDQAGYPMNNGYPQNQMASNNSNPNWRQDQYRGLQEPQYDRRGQVNPNRLDPGSQLPNPNFAGSRGSLVDGQHTPVVQNQVPRMASRVGYDDQNQAVPNDNGMQARIRANDGQTNPETVGANRGPNGESRAPVAQLNRINQVLFFFLLCSIGLNLYLGWISRGFYVRYRELADELRDTFATA